MTGYHKYKIEDTVELPEIVRQAPASKINYPFVHIDKRESFFIPTSIDGHQFPHIDDVIDRVEYANARLKPKRFELHARDGGALIERTQ